MKTLLRRAALCLTLLLIAVIGAEWPAATAQPGIFVPTPRGEGDTLDSTPAAGAAAGPEMIATRTGEQLVGRVVGIAAGRLRLIGPQFDGEVKVLLPGLDQVTLAPAAGAAQGRDAVLIGNGDSIMGEVTSMADDAVTVASDAAGPIKIPRRVVSAIGFNKAAGALVDSDFAHTMDPWKSVLGNWQIKDGALVNDNQGNSYTVQAAVEQTGPVSLEASVEMGPSWCLQCYLVLCSDGGNNNNGQPFGRSCVNVYFVNGQYIVYCTNNNGGNNQVGQGQLAGLGNAGESAVLRAAYDPETKKVKVWCNGKLAGEHDVPNGPAGGKFVQFCAQCPCKVKYLRATAGFSAPGDPGAAAKDDTVAFANKDAMSVKSITLADGKFTLRTSFGELTSTIEKVDRITFNSRNIERPRRQKGDVLVQTKTSRLTLQLESLTPDSLTGTSDYLGPVTIKRSAIKSIRFNLYETGASGSGAAPVRPPTGVPAVPPSPLLEMDD